MSRQFLTTVIQKWSQKRTWKNKNTNVHDSSAVSTRRMTIKTTNRKQKSKGGGMGRGINVDTHTHSTDWLLHLQGGGGTLDHCTG